MTLIYAYKGKTETRDITIKDADGDTITPGTSDKVRVVISREGETAKLTVSSDAATANGSSITKGATNRLRLDGEDLDFSPGTYTMLVEFFDNSDSQTWKVVDLQVFHLEGV